MAITTVRGAPRGAPRRPRRDPIYRAIVGLGLTTCGAMRWDLSVSGEEHVPTAGPAVLASNHIGVMDFVFLGLAAHRRGRFVRFMAMKEAFDNPLGGPLLRSMRHIPVDRRGDAAASYRQAVDELGEGEMVGLHPEGKINRALVPVAGKTGAVRMAMATGAPLLPAAIWGSQLLLAPGVRKFPRHVAVSVEIGPALEIEPGLDAESLTERLMDRIRDMWRGAVAASRGA